ncbi:Calx-beta domain-containing protein [Aliiglaciecola litoralis]|uniref:Calx-beta domain-containing protein n=1 Tax=Aliiglaciecola litoralis TaxID=582857 RepID=A0ABP3WYF8_9ALTE
MNKFLYTTLACAALVSGNAMAIQSGGNSSVGVANSSHSPVLSIPNFPSNTKQITTNILFYYTPAALERLGGIDELHAYIDTSLQYANQYMTVNNISLERRLSAVIPYPGNLDESEVSISVAANYVRENKEALESEYNASYYAVIVGSIPEGIAGLASLGGSVSYFTPHYGENLEYSTLAHMLGHNDGLLHDVAGNEPYPTMGGWVCGSVASMMATEVVKRNEFFMSSPEVINNETGEQCGDAEVADVRTYYYDAIESDRFIQAETPFNNYIAPLPAAGEITYSLTADTFNEESGSISVIVNWADVGPSGGTAEIYTKSGTADRNDFQFENQRIKLSTSSGSSVYEIILVDDTEIESVETFELGLRYPVGVNIGTQPTEISIVSEDTEDDSVGSPEKGDVQISGTLRVSEGQTVTLPLVRTGGSTGELVVNLSITDSTTTSDDYTISATQVTFLEGEKNKEVVLTAVEDSTVEDSETFTVAISSTADGSNVSGSVEVTIVDNDELVILPPPSQKKGSGGGGSIGLYALLLGFVGIIRRKQLRR